MLQQKNTVSHSAGNQEQKQPEACVWLGGILVCTYVMWCAVFKIRNRRVLCETQPSQTCRAIDLD